MSTNNFVFRLDMLTQEWQEKAIGQLINQGAFRRENIEGSPDKYRLIATVAGKDYEATMANTVRERNDTQTECEEILTAILADTAHYDALNEALVAEKISWLITNLYEASFKDQENLKAFNRKHLGHH